MQESKSLTIQSLRNSLKSNIKGNILDIFVIGSFLKNKLSPRDIDIIVLFKEKNMKSVEEDLYNIKEKLNLSRELHLEPLFIDNLLKEKIFFTILHEGFSIKEGKFISELTKLNSFVIFYYNLKNLSKLDKVKFAQAIYGRKKNGLLSQEKGISLGPMSFMVPVSREEIFKEFMKKWKINFERKRVFVSD